MTDMSDDGPAECALGRATTSDRSSIAMHRKSTDPRRRAGGRAPIADWAWLPLSVVAYAGLALEVHWLWGASWHAMAEDALAVVLALPLGAVLAVWPVLFLCAWLAHRQDPPEDGW